RHRSLVRVGGEGKGTDREGLDRGIPFVVAGRQLVPETNMFSAPEIVLVAVASARQTVQRPFGLLAVKAAYDILNGGEQLLRSVDDLADVVDPGSQGREHQGAGTDDAIERLDLLARRILLGRGAPAVIVEQVPVEGNLHAPPDVVIAVVHPGRSIVLIVADDIADLRSRHACRPLLRAGDTWRCKKGKKKRDGGDRRLHCSVTQSTNSSRRIWRTLSAAAIVFVSNSRSCARTTSVSTRASM